MAQLRADEEEEDAKAMNSARSKVLPREQIDAASQRNYQIAHDLNFKQLAKKTQADYDRMLQEERQCTFQPVRYRHAREMTQVASRYKLPRCPRNEHPQPGTATQNRKLKSHYGSCRGKISAHERLYALHVLKQKQRELAAMQAEVEERNARMRNRMSSTQTFVQRMEIDQIQREQNREMLAEKYEFPYTPTLSQRTEEICNELRTRSVEEIIASDQKRRLRRLQRHVAGPHQDMTHNLLKGSSHPIQVEVVTFEDLLRELRIQEQAMRQNENES